MQWEYIRVMTLHRRGTGSMLMKPAKVFMIGIDGDPLEIQKEPSESHHSQVLSRTLGYLGNDGWELVGLATTCETGAAVETVLYFKRQKPNGPR